MISKRDKDPKKELVDVHFCIKLFLTYLLFYLFMKLMSDNIIIK